MSHLNYFLQQIWQLGAWTSHSSFPKELLFLEVVVLVVAVAVVVVVVVVA